MNSRVIVTTTWSQVETNAVNSQEIFSDEGSILYDQSYTSGSGPRQINSVFHEVSVLAASGGQKTINLMSASGLMFGNNTVDSFTGVKLITIRNLSTDVEAYMDVIVTGANGFDQFFGNPTGNLVLSPSGCYHRSNTTTCFPVQSNEKNIVLKNDTDYPCYYEILVEGNK